MTIQLNPRARGVFGVRADAGQGTKILAELQKTFEEFKAERTKELDDIKAKMGDVVQTEKVDRINAEITQLTTALDGVNAQLAALKVGGGGGDAVNADVKAHADAFATYFRRGERAVQGDLGQLQVKAALTTDSDPDGGYLVPEEMATQVDRVLGTVSAIRSMAGSISISGGTYKKLVNLAGTGSGWVGERQARPETVTPQLSQIAIEAMELYANPAITQQALDDARLDIGAWLAGEVAVEFAEQEGEAFVTGDGVNKPRGILSYNNVANASYSWGNIGFVITGEAADFDAASTTVSPADPLIDLYYALRSGYRAGAQWLMSDATMNQVRKFKDAEGAFIWAPPTAMGEVATILGKPVMTDDNMPAVAADQFPIAFGNFQRGYLIVDRFGVRVLRDPFTNKPFVHFYTTRRVGGAVVNFEAIKLLKVAAT